jgi:tetratricopeptide (TPR) repeat protein
VNVNLQRGNLLFQQGRHAAAEAEFRLAASADPDAPEPHAMRALALLERQRWSDATDEARTAIGLAPDWGYAHYVLGKVLLERHLPEEARAAVEEAISLDPTDADAHVLLAAIHFDESRFADALQSAGDALEHDPEHAGGNNIRAMALVKLGRRAEAGATIDATLARDPGNAVTHANQGWTLLESGDRERALEHFREALRLEPDNEWARDGILTALKSKRWLYALVLKYFFLMSRLPPKTQGWVIFGGWMGNRALSVLSDQNPTMAPFVLPLQVLYVFFVFLTWTADPLANLLLRFDPFGRLVLTEDQLRASGWVGGLLAAALGAALAAFFTGANDLYWLAMVCGFMLIPVSAVFKCAEGPVRRKMTLYSVAMGAVGLASIVLPRTALLSGEALSDARAFLFLGFFVMLLGSGWFANWLIMKRTPR